MTKEILLDVPYSEKEEAKKLGARWKPEIKKWYIDIDNPNLQKLSRWFPESITHSNPVDLISHGSIYIIESKIKCSACWNETPTIGLCCTIIDDFSLYEHKPSEDFYVLDYMSELPESLIKKIQTINPRYLKDNSKIKDYQYFMNHCKCGAAIEDYFVSRSFSPKKESDLEHIKFTKIVENKIVKLKGAYYLGSDRLYCGFLRSQGNRSFTWERAEEYDLN